MISELPWVLSAFIGGKKLLAILEINLRY